MIKKKADPIWARIRREAQEGIQKEPLLASFLSSTILSHKTLEDVLSFHLAGKLESLHYLRKVCVIV
jgi:serine O-acetyltransferase